MVETMYQPGDIVIVRADLEPGKCYRMSNRDSHNIATHSMRRLVGCAVTIKDTARGQYRVVEDDSGCYWTDGMFEGYADQSYDLPPGLIDTGGDA